MKQNQRSQVQPDSPECCLQVLQRQQMGTSRRNHQRRERSNLPSVRSRGSRRSRCWYLTHTMPGRQKENAAKTLTLCARRRRRRRHPIPKFLWGCDEVQVQCTKVGKRRLQASCSRQKPFVSVTPHRIEPTRRTDRTVKYSTRPRPLCVSEGIVRRGTYYIGQRTF